MKPRLSLIAFNDEAGLIQGVSKALSELTDGTADVWTEPKTLYACCRHVAGLNARTAIIQRYVIDPDFLAEFNTYYSRQFRDCGRYCYRIHFFAETADGDAVLPFLDKANPVNYLGFTTLRPVGRTPVGATLLTPSDGAGRLRCLDRFPVHLAGMKFEVVGTPFLQQDNAVGACAQASIWMALRTMRKREGDRAFDPAQISGAATRYSVTSRILPNRSGLTWPQMIDAVRGAGYSPHPIPFAKAALGIKLSDAKLVEAKRQVLAYLDSEIPVMLVLYPSTGGHAVVTIGYAFSNALAMVDRESRSLERGVAIDVSHSSSWVSHLIIHNDNSGPYLPLPDRVGVNDSYALEQAFAAIPLLPADVFVSGEEAMEIGLELWESTLDDVTSTMSADETRAFADKFVLRLLLLEKRKIRAWATHSDVPAKVAEQLRLCNLPRRVWALEVHLKDEYPKHADTAAKSMVGFFLVDSTGDERENAMLMSYFNLPSFTTVPNGSMLVTTKSTWETFKVPGAPGLLPFRPIHRHAAAG